MAQISIAIPSKNEKFLRQTILDTLAKARGDIEIYPILDGYEPPESELVDDPRVHYVRLPATRASKKRQAINHVAQVCSGDYLMALDAHCMWDEGFDLKLLANIESNQIVIPRRHRLDAGNWCLQDQGGKPPIDYEYIMWPRKFNPQAFHGYRWDGRSIERAHILIDEILTFQGSCWLMSREHYQRMGFMDWQNYQGWGQEAEELSFTTWAAGGSCIVNKNTWYAHLHKGSTWGRMYYLDKAETLRSYAYCYARWKDTPEFRALIDKFSPLPGWPKNWTL